MTTDPLILRAAERLACYGPTAISDLELVALGAGLTRIEPAISTLRSLGLAALVGTSARELAKSLGLSPKRAQRFVCCLELARRAAWVTPSRGATIRAAKDAHQALRPKLQNLDHEEFWCLALDARHRILSIYCVSRGSMTSAQVHPREAFREAIRSGAMSVIYGHNHPSGDPTPSPEDIALTARLVEVGKLVGIKVLDHVIVAGDQFVAIGAESTTPP